MSNNDIHIHSMISRLTQIEVREKKAVTHGFTTARLPPENYFAQFKNKK